MFIVPCLKAFKHQSAFVTSSHYTLTFPYHNMLQWLLLKDIFCTSKTQNILLQYNGSELLESSVAFVLSQSSYWCYRFIKSCNFVNLWKFLNVSCQLLYPLVVILNKSIAPLPPGFRTFLCL